MPIEQFVVAMVHEGQITHMRGYATEPEAQDALHADSLDTLPDARQPAAGDPKPKRRQQV